jgi:hypothetical protein
LPGAAEFVDFRFDQIHFASGAPMMRTLRIVIVACCAAVSARCVEGGPFLVKNISTGIDPSTGNQLPDGVSDANYKMGATSVQFANTIPFAWNNQNLPSTYVPNSASTASEWITVSNQEISPGDYYFDTTVDLTGLNPQSAFIQGFRYAADNELYRIIINNTTVYTNPVAQVITTEEFHNFISLGNVGLGHFQPGVNTIQFDVLNFHRANVTVSAMAFRAEGALMATPEPSTLALAAFGLAGLTAWHLRNRRPLSFS